MRNFSLISLLIALAIGGFVWQKMLVKSVPDRLPDPADYSTSSDTLYEEHDVQPECDEYNQDSPECQPEMESAEQSEMEEQRRQGHDVMMKSFNSKYDKYKEQTGIGQ